MPRATRITLLTIATVAIFVALLPRLAETRFLGNNEGYSPDQPIAYSHRLHAGTLGIDCLYCHSAAEHGRHAGIPSADVCMNCHSFVTATWDAVREEITTAKKEGRKAETLVSPELEKLYRAMGLNRDRVRDESIEPSAIEWMQVHRLPDFTYFNHSVHVRGGVKCQTCHGPVETMERMRQHATLSMGWCIECHRENNKAIDPTAPAPETRGVHFVCGLSLLGSKEVHHVAS